MLYTYSSQGSNVHNSSPRVLDALRVCEDAKALLNSKIVSIPVDNAAVSVATQVSAGFEENAILSRDPAHCVNLLSKDLAKTKVVSKILQETKEVYNLVHEIVLIQ